MTVAQQPASRNVDASTMDLGVHSADDRGRGTFRRDDLLHVGKASVVQPSPEDDVGSNVHEYCRERRRTEINRRGFFDRFTVFQLQLSRQLPDIMSWATFSALSIGSNSSNIWYVRIIKNV